MGDLEVREKAASESSVDSRPGGRENESGSGIAIIPGQLGLTDRFPGYGPLMWIRAGRADRTERDLDGISSSGRFG